MLAEERDDEQIEQPAAQRRSGDERERQEHEEQTSRAPCCMRPLGPGIEQPHVAQVGLPGGVEEIAEERYDADHAFDRDVERHAGEDRAADAEPVRLREDVARYEHADEIADEREEAHDRVEAHRVARPRDRDRAVKQPGEERQPLAHRALLIALGCEHFAFQHSLRARHRSIILAPHCDHLKGVPAMTIKVGDRLPDGKLMESTEFDSGTQCAMPPKEVHVADAVKGKKIAIFGLPGAYTPTCSAKHVPSYVQNIDPLRKKGVNEVWCLATNDAFVMAHWGRDQKALGKIRFLADGSAEWTKKLGLELDLSARGMGTRMQRFSMLVDNGVVKQLNVEAPGKFEISDAATMLKQLG